MKVIFGLGNPEVKFDASRHNVGFFVLDHLAGKFGVVFRDTTKCKAAVAEYTHAGEKILLVKPTTYYNQVGESARAIADFYKLSPNDFLVIHDDLALPLGTIRTRTGGSDGGNNGLKSLAAHLSLETCRVRVGVWTEQHHGVDKVQTVLGKFTLAEQAILVEQLATITQITEQFLGGTFTATTYTRDEK